MRFLSLKERSAGVKNDIRVRRFKKEDAQEVRNLVVRNFLEVNSKDYGLAAMEKLAETYDVAKILNLASYAHTYVLEWKGKIVGTGSISSFWGSTTESILLTIFVMPEFHGKGIGTKIINILDRSRQWNFTESLDMITRMGKRSLMRNITIGWKRL